MKFNTIKDWEQITSYESDWNPTLLNPKITISFWDEIIDGFNWTWNYAEAISKPTQLDDINLMDLDSKFFLLEFQNISERDSIMKQLQERIIMKNTLMSEELENWRQIPWVSGIFERDWKFYIIVHSYLKNTDETNPEKWIYKWSIVNPIAYYGVQEEIENSQKSIWDNVKGIIDNPELD